MSKSTVLEECKDKEIWHTDLISAYWSCPCMDVTRQQPHDEATVFADMFPKNEAGDDLHVMRRARAGDMFEQSLNNLNSV